MELRAEDVKNIRSLAVCKEFLRQAIEQIDQLNEELRWRKFPDEKPKWGEEVLVVDDESKQYIVRFSHDMKWISWGKMNTCESNCVKYWRPLSKAPEDKQMNETKTTGYIPSDSEDKRIMKARCFAKSMMSKGQPEGEANRIAAKYYHVAEDAVRNSDNLDDDIYFNVGSIAPLAASEIFDAGDFC